MSWWRRLLGSLGEGWVSKSPGDDYWFTPRMPSTMAGIPLGPQEAMAVAAVYGCVKVISEDIAKLPLVLYRRVDDGKEKAVDHPLYTLFHRKPNRAQTAFGWREMLQNHLCLRGNAYAEIRPGRFGGQTGMQLIPLLPDFVRVIKVDPDGFPALYSVRNAHGGPLRELQPSQLLHLKGMQATPLGGVSPIAAQADTIADAKASRDFASRVFRSFARPGLIFSHPRTLNKEAKDNLKASVDAGYTGDNVFRTMVVEEGMTVEALQISMDDLQLIQSRKMGVEEICRIYRVAPHKVQELSRATFSNIEQQNINHVQDCLLPWCVRWEQELSASLLDEDDLFLEFNLEGVMRGDSVARSTFYHFAITDGWLTRNEVRELENRTALPGLDRPLEPLNMAAPGDRGGATPAGADPWHAWLGELAERIAAAERRERDRIAADPIDGHPRRIQAIAKFYERTHRQYVDRVLTPLLRAGITLAALELTVEQILADGAQWMLADPAPAREPMIADILMRLAPPVPRATVRSLPAVAGAA